MIFSGTVKSNLDPWGGVKDEQELWKVLEQTGLRGAIEEMEVGSAGGFRLLACHSIQ